MKARQQILWALFSLGMALAPAFAAAQTPQSTVLQMNQQAMSFYANLQLDQAQQLLLQAESVCKQYGVSGTPLARTYVNLGIVQGGGYQNNAGANDYFVRAICADPKVTLDPMYGTDDINTLFKMASSQAKNRQNCARGSAGPVPPPPGPSVAGGPVPPPPLPAAVGTVVTEVLRHTPVAQQTRLVPIPLFVEINPNLDVGKVVVFYRTLGETIFQQLPMEKYANGWAATIDCKVLQTFDPAGIEYYIAVIDAKDQLLGTSGSELSPFTVSIVPQLTMSPPALPKSAPPPKCVEECPPWNPNCNANCKQMGDMCDDDSACCSGMVCENEVCTPSEDDRPAGNFRSHARMGLMVGTGAGLVNAGTVDPPNQSAPGSLDMGTGFALDKFHARFQLLINLKPDLFLGIGLRGDFAFDPSLPVVQPAGMINFGYRLVGTDNKTFELLSLFGLGAGVFQHRVSYSDCRKYTEGCAPDALNVDDPDNPYWTGADAVTSTYFRKAGLLIVEAGLEANFWFINNFGWNVGVLVDVLIPVKFDFAINFDIQTGPVLRF